MQAGDPLRAADARSLQKKLERKQAGHNIASREQSSSFGLSCLPENLVCPGYQSSRAPTWPTRLPELSWLGTEVIWPKPGQLHEVPVIVLDHLSEAQKRAWRLGFGRTQERSRPP